MDPEWVLLNWADLIILMTVEGHDSDICTCPSCQWHRAYCLLTGEPI